MLTLLTALNLLALTGAAYFQHALHYEPCPWCILIRVLFVVLLILTPLAMLSNKMARAGGQISLAIFGMSGVIACSYMHLVASHSDACFKTFADKIIEFMHLDSLAPWYFEPRGLCTDASVNIAGMPMEAYALIIFMGYAIYGIVEFKEARAEKV